MREDLTQMPTGGLASFLTSNMDEIDDNVLAFGKASGINSMSKIANRMANMGRNGDNELVHVKTGELIVSPEVLEKNPKLAQELAQEFQNSNENMSDYVVGSEGNSINPLTGQREFFLKGLVKGIKSLFTTVAPMLLTNFLFPGAGSILKGVIGGGIGGLLQGRGLTGALQGAATGGLLGGLQAGFFGKGDSFMGRIGADLGMTDFTPKTIEQMGADFKSIKSGGKGILDRILPSTPQIGDPDFEKIYQDYLGKGIGAESALRMTQDAVKPGMMDYVPAALAGTAAIGALGGFDTPEQEMPDPYGVTSRELIDKDPGRYRVLPKYIAPRGTELADVQVPTPDPYLFAKYLEEQPRTAAHGGEMFPRKTGAINGPGTATSDDVPAMLSDGEFVMTSRAVRGLGNGSRQQGVKKMYDMMKNFERSVPA